MEIRWYGRGSLCFRSVPAEVSGSRGPPGILRLEQPASAGFGGYLSAEGACASEGATVYRSFDRHRWHSLLYAIIEPLTCCPFRPNMRCPVGGPGWATLRPNSSQCHHTHFSRALPRPASAWARRWSSVSGCMRSGKRPLSVEVVGPAAPQNSEVLRSMYRDRGHPLTPPSFWYPWRSRM